MNCRSGLVVHHLIVGTSLCRDPTKYSCTRSSVHHFGDRVVQSTPVHMVQCTLCIASLMRSVYCIHHSMNWWSSVPECCAPVLTPVHCAPVFQCTIPQTNGAMSQSVVHHSNSCQIAQLSKINAATLSQGKKNKNFCNFKSGNDADPLNVDDDDDDYNDADYNEDDHNDENHRCLRQSWPWWAGSTAKLCIINLLRWWWWWWRWWWWSSSPAWWADGWLNGQTMLYQLATSML